MLQLIASARLARLRILVCAALAALALVCASPARADDPPAVEQPGGKVTAAQDPHGSVPHADDHGPKAGVLPTTAQGIVPMVVALLVFGGVFAILATAVWPKIVKALKDREEKIRTEIESAESARQQAKDALQQYQRSLSEARAEAQKMLEQARAQQATLASELKAKADADLTLMRDKARRDIEAAKRAAIAEIYADASTFATTMASKILKREVTHSDQQALVEESLAALRARSN